MSRAGEFFGAANDHSGGGIERMFPEQKPLTMVPWDQMGRRKDRQDYDRQLVADTLRKPPTENEFHDLDPRNLRATQPSITRAGVSHYLSNDYREGGPTYADQHDVGNQHPVVYRRAALDAGMPHQDILLSGHHRAAASLLHGDQFRARLIEGGWGPPRGKDPE
jgi:hypothetical protein